MSAQKYGIVLSSGWGDVTDGQVRVNIKYTRDGGRTRVENMTGPRGAAGGNKKTFHGLKLLDHPNNPVFT